MCGIVGIAGKLEYKDEATMKRLFLLDFFRGPDSTGLAAIRGSGEAKIAKLSSHPIDIFDTPKFKDALNGNTSIAFIGHNRAATRGGVNTFNAHPFHFDHIVGVHNGTLDTESVKNLEDALGERHAVDSQALYAAIAKFGIEETISMCNEGRDSQTGAWSLVWYDQIEGSLNFLRNKHRPMWLAYSDEFDRIFYASEWPMIDAAVAMSTQGYKLYRDPQKGYRFWATDENLHYKFDLGTLKSGGKELPKPKVKEIRGKEPSPAASTGGNYPFRHGAGSNTHSSGRTTTTGVANTPGSTTPSPSKKFIHLVGDDTNPLAGYFTRQQFENIAKHGCSFCHGEIAFDMPGMTIYERDDIVLCPACSNHGHSTDGTPVTRIFVAGGVIEAML